MCQKFHIRVVHFFDMLKKKSIYTKCLCLLSQIFSPGLPKLNMPKIGIYHCSNGPKIPPDRDVDCINI